MTFEELTRRPPWMADALCREYPQWSWFPGSGQPAKKLLAVCGACSVRTECLEYGADQRYGIWGGVPTSVRLRSSEVAA
jgi:WhiB family redox-sensing transcriptional regulator